MKIKKNDYLGLKHEAVCKKFEGELSFINYMCITDTKGNSYIGAVYKAAKPNKKKGHKKYMVLFSQLNPETLKSQFYVTGKTEAEMKKDRIHNGVLCTHCKDVIVSLSGHDFVNCSCGEAFIDGGKNYIRYGGGDLSKLKLVKVDLLTDKIILD